MKKFIALILAVLLIASMSVTAFAADVADGDITSNTANKKDGDVKVQVTDKDGNPITTTGTYKVTVQWGNLLFKIKVNDADTDVQWDGSKYTLTNAAWDHTSAVVTVTNYSDMAISVDGKFGASDTSEAVDGVTATITGGVQPLTSAVGLTTAPVARYTVAISAVPTTVTKLEFTVDTVNLTIQTTN